MECIGSIFSIILTIITLWIQRNHDRLSVKPLANIHLNNFPGEITILIHNDGLGPMIIKLVDTYRTKDTNKISYGWPPKPIDRENYHNLISMPVVMGHFDETPILNGKSIPLLTQKFDINDSNQVKDGNKTRESLKDFTIKVKYTSIYENEQFETILKLDNLGEITYQQNFD